MIKIVIIDDHQMIVDGVKSVLTADPGLHVVASAGLLSRGLTLVQEHDPDVVLLDVRLADVSGAQVVERMRRVTKRAKIIVMTGFGTGQREDCMKAGADAFLSKESASDLILRTIRQYFPITAESGGDALSPRESEIAGLVAAGKSNPEIASALGVSVNTVKTHLSHVMAKMGVTGRVELSIQWRNRAFRARIHTNG